MSDSNHLKKLVSCLVQISDQPEHDINRLVRFCGTMLKADCALYNRLEDELLCSIGQWNAPPGFKACDHAQGHICYDVIHRDLEEPLIIRDLQNTVYAKIDPHVATFGLKTYVGIAVKAKGQAKGALCLVYQRDLVPDEEQLQILKLSSYGVAAAEERLLSNRQHQHAQQQIALQAQILDSLSESVVVTDFDETIIFWNRGAEELYGFQSAETLGHPYRQFAGGRTPDASPSVVRKEILARGKWSGEHWQIRKDGSRFWSDTHISILRDTQGQPAGFIGIDYDITKRKQAIDELLITRQSYQDVINTISEAIYIQDPSGPFIEVNEGAARMYRCPRDYLIGKTPADVAAPGKNDLNDLAAKSSEVFETGKPISFEFWAVRADGEVFLKEVVVNKGRYFGKDVLIATARDQTDKIRAATEKDQLQAQLTHALKMESVGRLAGGVAHDFNNMLGIILGNADIALESLKQTDPLHDELQEIKNAAHRSADLTRQLLAFARRQPVNPKVLELNSAIQATIKMLRRLIDENIRIHWEPGDAPSTVIIDPSQLDQILINLCVNARDAIGNTGNITLHTTAVEIRKEDCAQFFEASPGNYAVLMIDDTGCGMTPDIMEHIFEPFFTTKAEGEGTGLGLATVYGIVHQNHGFIHVESEAGRGTSFQIYLPRYFGEDQREYADVLDFRPGLQESILLVEDEPGILMITAKMLDRLGFKVITAGSGKEALALAEQPGTKLDLLVTDVIMPILNGWDLYGALAKTRPGLKALFMSGYTAQVLENKRTSGRQPHFIQKPFTFHQLSVAVNQALRS